MPKIDSIPISPTVSRVFDAFVKHLESDELDEAHLVPAPASLVAGPISFPARPALPPHGTDPASAGRLQPVCREEETRPVELYEQS